MEAFRNVQCKLKPILMRRCVLAARLTRADAGARLKTTDKLIKSNKSKRVYAAGQDSRFRFALELVVVMCLLRIGPIGASW